MDTHPLATMLFFLVVVLVGAKLGAELAVRLGQPAVLGELVVGIALGNLDLVGITQVEAIARDPLMEALAELGVLLLLFEVGLESTVKQMLGVGRSALLVAIAGIVAPFTLGWAAAAALLPDRSPLLHAFVGATMAATSVGITARVFQDLGRSKRPEARLILGSAVIDDVLGLVILAIITAVIGARNQGETVSYAALSFIGLKAVVFLAVSLGLGVWLMPRTVTLVAKLRGNAALLVFGLSFCFLLAWLASLVGLAPLIGAFAAGLILEDVHYRDFENRGEHGLEELIHPVAAFLVPIFFVLTGMKTDLRMVADPHVLGLTAALVVVAILGKLASGLGVAEPGIDRLTVGLGMVPRGEVGLVFASLGATTMLAGAPLVSPPLYATIVLVVIVTTLATPPALAWRVRQVSAATAPR